MLVFQSELTQVRNSRGRSCIYSIDILNALREIDPEGKEYVALVFQSVPVSRSSFDLSGRLLHDSLVRRRAIELAQGLVSKKTVEAARVVKPLLGALSDPSCRIQAINALAGLGVEAKDAIPALTALKRDPDQATREAAMEALKKIQ